MPVSGSAIFAFTALLAGLAFGRLFRIWWKYSGPRVIVCPESQRPAGVSVDAGRVAATSLWRAPKLRLSECSRWPERAGCGQQCLSQIETAPADCLVRHILSKWYEGKTCASCRRPFGDLSQAARKPAVLLAEKKSVEWSEIPADQLQDTLEAAEPICFACHMANRLVQEHPELVVDRPRG